MKKLLHVGIFVFTGLMATIMFSSTAFAYIDPAATSYIVQIVAGVVIASSVAVAVFWKKIRLFFQKQKIKNLEKKLTKQADKKEQ